MHRWIILAVVAACSGSAKPQPIGVAAVAKARSEPTCAEVGVILRGEVTADDEAAGPAREQAIQGACEGDHWAPDVIRCVAGTAHPSDCLARLSGPQQTSYDTRLKAWSDKYGVTVEATPVDPGLTCEEGLHNSDAIKPALDDNSPERTWQSELRHRELVATCERTGWNPVTRSCLAIATTPEAADPCLRSELDPSALDVLYKRYADAAAAAKSIATLRATPTKIDCKHVVDAHYADAKWHGKAKPEDRKQSRNKMLLACKQEAWDELRRACTIVDSPFCEPDLRWDYPALTSACEGYAVAIEKLSHCDALPAATRDALRQAFDATRLTGALDAACEAGANAVLAVMRSASC